MSRIESPMPTPSAAPPSVTVMSVALRGFFSVKLTEPSSGERSLAERVLGPPSSQPWRSLPTRSRRCSDLKVSPSSTFPTPWRVMCWAPGGSELSAVAAATPTARPRAAVVGTMWRRLLMCMGRNPCRVPDVRQSASAPENGVQHRLGQLPGERVLLARVEAAEQHRATAREGEFRAMTELRPWPDGVQPACRIPGERAQADDHPHLGHEREL